MNLDDPDDPHGRVRHVVQTIAARWADIGTLQTLPRDEVVRAASQDVATLVNQLQKPARQAQLEEQQRAVQAELALSVLGRLAQHIVATPALHAALHVYRLPQATKPLADVLEELLLQPTVAAVLPPLDTVRPALANLSVQPGDDADVAAAGRVAQALIENAPEVADLGGVPASYIEEQAALLGDADTGVEEAF